MWLGFWKRSANLFTPAGHFLHDPESCLIEILFGMELGPSLWGFLCRFLFHGRIMAGWRGESIGIKFKLYHYRLGWCLDPIFPVVIHDSKSD